MKGYIKICLLGLNKRKPKVLHPEFKEEAIRLAESSGWGHNASTTQHQLAFDLSPLLGYRFNKRFTLGVGATYRLALSKNPVSVITEDATYGGRAYAEYHLIKSFLLHAEYERMSQAVLVADQDATGRSWQTSLCRRVAEPTVSRTVCVEAQNYKQPATIYWEALRNSSPLYRYHNHSSINTI